MKFRAKTCDTSSVQHFSKVIAMMSKLTKSCVLRITYDKLYFILAERVVNGGVSIWCELKKGHVFDEWCMEGVDVDTDNEIYLEFLPENVNRALKSSSSTAKSLKMKLTKKHGPCLSLELELPSLSAYCRITSHDIPVNVIPRRVWVDYQEPSMPDFDVSIYLPPLKTLKNVVERMKNLSTFVIIAANNQGELTLRVETDLVTVSTYFRHLDHPEWVEGGGGGGGVGGAGGGSGGGGGGSGGGCGQARRAEEMVCARVEIKRLLQLLTGLVVSSGGQGSHPHTSSHTKVICNIIDNKIVHFYIVEDDVSLQYFVPATAV